MRVIYGMLGHEANTFSSEKGDFSRFAPNGWATGAEIYAKFRHSNSYLSGMISAAEEYGAELIPTVAIENAAPVLTEDCVRKTAGKLLEMIRDNFSACDGICLALHGAGVAEGIPDLEAFLLSEIRTIVGNDMPVTISLDLHGNISEKIVRLSDGIFGIKEYPHTDMKEAGALAMRSLIEMICGRLRLETAFVPLRMLVPCQVGDTTREPMKWFTDYVKQYKETHRLYDATFFHGFPYADVNCSSASVVTAADKNSLVTAEQAARELACEIWKNREKLNRIYPQPAEALRRAQRESDKLDRGYVLVNESSDNAGGGCPGDGTYLLRALIEADIPRSIFGFLFDRDIAVLAHQTGVGGKISGLLGGKTDTLHGEPILIKDAEICALSEGKTRYQSPVVFHLPVDYGRSALLKIGNVKVVVTEIMPEQTFDDSPFQMMGQDLSEYRIVCIKSTNHFRAFFEKRAAAIITTDPPGIQTGNLKQLKFQNIRRPVWPLENI